jgi:hypothetical protein
MAKKSDRTNRPDRDRIQDMIHRRGTPPVPASTTLKVEVRTDGFIPLPSPVKGQDFAIGAVLIEWTFGVPLAEVQTFNTFLSQNEAYIAASCAKLMKGVAYRGTYMTGSYGRFRYRSLWSYEEAASLDQWNAVLTGKSKFITALTRLRSYWTADPSREEHRYHQAGLVTDLAALGHDKPFLALTLAAAALKRP